MPETRTRHWKLLVGYESGFLIHSTSDAKFLAGVLA
jgi:hypothetical protein